MTHAPATHHPLFRHPRRARPMLLRAILLGAFLAVLAASFAPTVAHADTARFAPGWSGRYAADQFERYAGKTPGVDWEGPTGEWYERAVAWRRTGNVRSPAIGAIAVWRNGEAGHVAVVRMFTANTVTIAEANWGVPKAGCETPEAACFGQTENFSRWQARVLQFEEMRQRGDYAFVGYIYPERVLNRGAVTPTATPSPTAPAAGTPTPTASGTATPTPRAADSATDQVGRTVAPRPPATLPAPTEVKATALDAGGVRVRWQASAGAKAYLVERRVQGESWEAVSDVWADGTPTQSILDVTAPVGRRASYRVTALAELAVSPPSASDSATAKK